VVVAMNRFHGYHCFQGSQSSRQPQHLTHFQLPVQNKYLALLTNFNICMTRYSLVELKVPLNSNQPTNSHLTVAFLRLHCPKNNPVVEKVVEFAVRGFGNSWISYGTQISVSIHTMFSSGIFWSSKAYFFPLCFLPSAMFAVLVIWQI